MSKTMHVDLHDADHYAYMAVVMAEEFEMMLKRNTLLISLIPSGVKGAALRFLERANEAIVQPIPRNPVAYMNDLLLVMDALGGAVSRKTCGMWLQEMMMLLNDLKKRRLTEKEREALLRFKNMFWQLAEKGNQVAYERAMGGDDDDE